MYWRSYFVTNMLVNLILVTRNKTVAQVFSKERNGLIPRGILDKARKQYPGLDFSLSAFPYSQNLSALPKYLLTKCSKEGVIILVDGLSMLAEIPEKVRTSCLVTYFNENDNLTKNKLSQKISVAVKYFLTVSEFFNRRGDRALLSLPFINFSSDALEKLYQNMVYAMADANKFAACINELKKHRKPRRNANSAKKLLLSDHHYFFEYASEKHARVATGEPHNELCVLAGRFRFGCKLEPEQHYNMYKEVGSTTVSPESIKNCHGSEGRPRAETHVNIFSNDYFT